MTFLEKSGIIWQIMIGNREKDQRYQKNEEAIMSAFFRAQKGLNGKQLAKAARVSRATLYRHHKGAQAVMSDIEQMILEAYKKDIAKVMNGGKLRVMFYRMLLFIEGHQKEFELIENRGDERALEEMVLELVPQVVRKYKIPAKYEEVLRIYEKEVTAVVETWILAGFSTSDMGVLKDIMYLTRSLRERLVKIGH